VRRIGEKKTKRTINSQKTLPVPSLLALRKKNNKGNPFALGPEIRKNSREGDDSAAQKGLKKKKETVQKPYHNKCAKEEKGNSPLGRGRSKSGLLPRKGPKREVVRVALNT